MKETTEKIRALHIQMVATVEAIRDKLSTYERDEPARALYDAYATVAEASADLWDVLVRLDNLQKVVDSSG